MDKNGCIYTCLIGQYDSLLIPSVIDDEYDYICYTDQPQLLKNDKVGPWEIRPLIFKELDPTRNQRWHKIVGYKEIGNYKYSIYIDNNVNISSEYIYELGKNTDRLFLIPKHSARQCIYDEADACSKLGKDSKSTCSTVKSVFESQGMPRYYGLTENNLLFRVHNNNELDSLMDEWWEHVRSLSKRDQLSLCFILWKRGIYVNDITIPNIRNDKKNFKVYPHIRDFNIISYLWAITIGLYHPYQPFKTFLRICPRLPGNTLRFIVLRIKRLL